MFAPGRLSSIRLYITFTRQYFVRPRPYLSKRNHDRQRTQIEIDGWSQITIVEIRLIWKKIFGYELSRKEEVQILLTIYRPI